MGEDVEDGRRKVTWRDDIDGKRKGEEGGGRGWWGEGPGRGQQRGDRRGTREGRLGPGEGRRRGRDEKGMTRKGDEGEMMGFELRQVQPLDLLGRGTLRKKRRCYSAGR